MDPKELRCDLEIRESVELAAHLDMRNKVWKVAGWSW